MENRFNHITLSFGFQKPGNFLNPEYKLLTDIGVKEFVTSCSCTNTTLNKETNTISINFRVPEIPQHLSQLGTAQLPQSRSIKVIFEDGVEQELSFTFTIKK